MLIPAFQLHLKDRILEGLATVGTYDGKHPSLTAATSGGKIFIHSPHTREGKDGSGVRHLNINKQISAVGAGCLDKSKRDVLFVGTQSDLLAYDIDNNSDRFFKDVPEGVNTVLCGKVGSLEEPLALVGGNCSIQGFNNEGEERFWTVTGDNVRSLALCDVNGDGQNELLVGSDDFDIRTFSNEEIMAEVTEADRVVGLCALNDSRFGYALGNGTIGVYDGVSRAWRVKSKNSVTAIAAYDLDGDGVPELVSGWANGKMEVRSDRDGSVVYRDNFSSSVSAILKADYRNDGQEEVICCSLEGEVRGYLPVEQDARGFDLLGRNNAEEALAELNQRKQELLYELSQYEANLAQLKSKKQGANEGIVPASTHVTVTLEMNPEQRSCELNLATNNETVIKGAIVFAEQLFDGESLYVQPAAPANKLRVPLAPRKDVSADMLIKVLVGSRMSPVFHVFELDYRLPKFCMYMAVKDQVPTPTSSCTFRLEERIPRVAAWIDACFATTIVASGLPQDALEASFVSLRDGKPLCFAMKPDGNLTVWCNDIDVVSEVVQDLTSYLGVTELESLADFPYEMEHFRSVLLKVDEYNAIRLRLTAEMADSTNLVKMLVIRAEDARILADSELMRKMYGQLFELNRELISEHTKRATNHQELLNALKDVNQMIQKAARLRVGHAKSHIVTACRAAIKSNNIHSLFRIIASGTA